MTIRKLLHEDGFTIAGARKALDEGTATQPTASASSANEKQVREALDRIKATRESLAAQTERYRAVGVASFLEQG